MSTIDSSSWSYVGETTNTTFYLLEPRVLIAVVKVGSRDTPATAQENIDFYTGHFRKNGPGALIYVLRDLLDQTAAARRMYKDQEIPELVCGVALVVQSPLSRAIASFFLGLSRPKNVPIETVNSVDEGLRWVHSKLAEWQLPQP